MGRIHFNVRRNTMKKILLFTLLLCITATAASASRIKVVATYPYIASIVSQIGKDRVKVDHLARGDYDPHTIVPKPSYIAKLRRADLLIISGAQLEIGWIPPLIRQANNPIVNPGKAGFLELSRFINLIDVPTSISRAQGDIHPDGNPHFYLDPYNIPPVAKAIKDRLAELDSHNTSFYETNLNEFLDRWNGKTKEWSGKLEKCRGMRVIEYHKNYDYLIRRFGMQLIGTVEPLPGIPPTSKHIADLDKILQTSKVECVLHDVYHPDDASRYLSGKHNVKLIILPHDVGAVNEAEGIFSLFDEIVRRLTK